MANIERWDWQADLRRASFDQWARDHNVSPATQIEVLHAAVEALSSLHRGAVEALNEFRDGLTEALNAHGVPAMGWREAIDWLAANGGRSGSVYVPGTHRPAAEAALRDEGER